MMKRSFGVWILLSGCVAGGGDGRTGGGGGDGAPDTADGDTSDSGDTGSPAAPVVVPVCSDAEHTTPQAGVDAAPDGAVVELCDERFEGTIVVSGRSLTIRGEPGAVLDGDGGQVITVVGSAEAPAEVAIESLTITGGWGDQGGGVWCEAATLSLLGVTIQENGAEEGGGIAASGCAVTMERVALTANEAWGEGGGGWFSGGSLEVVQSVVSFNRGADGGGLLVRGATGEVRDSWIEDNEGHVGGGIWFDGSFAFTHNRVLRNTALYTGGGFGAVNGSGAISRNVVRENHSFTDGGGGFTEAHTGDVTDNLFEDNTSTDDAGGLRMLYGAALIQGNTFRSNLAPNGDGGAMKVSHAGCEIRDNTFTENVASNGGGIEVDDDISFLSGNTFLGNRASDRGGALHFNEPYWNMAIEDLLMEGNEAGGCGGAIGMDDDGMLESPEDRYTVQAARLLMRDNTAGDGGAICVFQGGIALTNSLIEGNDATGAGGAVLVDGATLSLVNVTVVENSAATATLVLRNTSDTIVTDSIFAGNTGGLVLAERAFPAWRYTLHHGNSGVAFGGMSDPTGENGNIEEDPAFVDAASGDWHLGAGSPAVDAGDPSRTDADGSRADMGTFGGSAAPDW